MLFSFFLHALSPRLCNRWLIFLLYLNYLFFLCFFLSFCCSVSRVGRRNKIGHPVHRHKRFKQGPLSVRCLVEYIDLQLGETVQALYGGNLISFPVLLFVFLTCFDYLSSFMPRTLRRDAFFQHDLAWPNPPPLRTHLVFVLLHKIKVVNSFYV